MTKKADFNAEEWSAVLEGPPIAGMMVITAERGGTLRESVSMGQAYLEARKQQDAGELLDDILAARPELDPKRFSSPDELKTKGLERLGEAVALLDSKADAGEVEAYKRFVLAVATKVANAHREGGVLGMGGKPVSENEQRTLDEIASTLGVEGQTPAP